MWDTTVIFGPMCVFMKGAYVAHVSLCGFTLEELWGGLVHTREVCEFLGQHSANVSISGSLPAFKKFLE